MRSTTTSLALAVVLVTLAGCDEGGGGADGSGGRGEGGAGGAGPAGPGPSTGAAPWWSTTGAGPLRTSEEICAGACACDAACAAESARFVPDCVNRFEEDRRAAELARCGAAYEAYYACFSRSWSCDAPDACEDEVEAFGACVATLCEAASAICGCPECQSECRTYDERCTSQCIVASGSCYGDDPALYECFDACYGVDASSGAGGGF